MELAESSTVTAAEAPAAEAAVVKPTAAVFRPETLDLPPIHTDQRAAPPLLPPPSTKALRRRLARWRPWVTWTLFLAMVIGLAVLAVREMESSQLQARYLTQLGRQLSFHVEPGPAPADEVRYPVAGPFDERMGYVQLPAFLRALQAKGYAVESQARMSPRMRELVDWGLFAVYPEKIQAGLQIFDRSGEAMYTVRYPGQVYAGFDDIPALVVNSLLYIENRELLDAHHPTRNPAVEWDRLFKAVGELVLSKVADDGQNVVGGSTLATQIEKYRHSPDGLTMSAKDKLKQMATASVRAYKDGEDTMAYRRKIVLNYINTVPLAARAGYGEINGIGDGLLVWYGAKPAKTNETLRRLAAQPVTAEVSKADAIAYKQVLSLFLAQRRPSFYLSAKPERLNTLTNIYLGLMADAGVISPKLAATAKAIPLRFRETIEHPPVSFVASKANNAVRSRLTQLLNVPRLYDLDRLDLSVKTTLDSALQAEATRTLRSLRDPAAARAAALYGDKLLQEGDDLSRIVYSFTLMERTPDGNRLRVQTDNFEQPFDINEGVKLDLGSTAKLRTLVTYLNIVAALHERYGAMTHDELVKVEVSSNNMLALWALDYLKNTEDRNLTTMLEAAMDRPYSASPNEQFFTGGGLHTFENFNKQDNGKVMPVREALRNSVNLVFVRMMRDIVRYYMTAVPGSSAKLLEDVKDERRPAYLARFADREGSLFVSRFYRKYQGKTPEQAMELLLASVRPTPQRLATVFNSVVPSATFDEFSAFLRGALPVADLSDKDMHRLYEKYAVKNFSLPDRGYIARVHPLELWTVAYLRTHPKAGYQEVLDASRNERQEVYSWLFKTRHKNAQDSRIRSLLELEAFQEIHKEWKRLGYPFDSLVASYATSIGSSADRPAALAELMGIIVNNGVRSPIVRLEQLHFAANTPYDAVVTRQAAAGEQVMPAEVATVVRHALADVVAQGTARRLNKAFTLPDGTEVTAGGKTGTGDQRFDVYGKGGRLIQSRVVNRTATFVFYIGDRFFGTLTAYVHGSEAAKYRFTSGLPVQVLKSLAPVLTPLLEQAKVEEPPAEEEENVTPGEMTPAEPPAEEDVPDGVIKPQSPPDADPDEAPETVPDEAPVNDTLKSVKLQKAA